MNKTLKDINMVTLPFAILLRDITDTGAELMHPDEFSRRNQSAYKTVLEGLREYLFDGNQYMLNQYFEARDALQELLNRAEELATRYSELTSPPEPSPYRAGLAMYVSSQLSDLITLIHPKNLEAL